MRNFPVSAAAVRATPVKRIEWLLLLAICAPWLQGGLVKLSDFSAAVAEMQHFGLLPAAPFAVAVILLELGGSLLILTGRMRWLAALALAIFTLAATFIANRYWLLSAGERGMVMNAFFEHIALVGALLYVALNDLRSKA
ncbi:DoxX family protein [Pantoea sp. B65]|uniref:DoxX family protein n=1 Tax=Pantoea sp. B65 TaxID=2813359 RepID=UPI0039B5B855